MLSADSPPAKCNPIKPCILQNKEMIYAATNEKMAFEIFATARLLCLVSVASMIYFCEGERTEVFIPLSWSYFFLSSIADRKKSYVCLAVNFPTW